MIITLTQYLPEKRLMPSLEGMIKIQNPACFQKQRFNNFSKGCPLKKGFKLVVNRLTMPYLIRFNMRFIPPKVNMMIRAAPHLVAKYY